MEHEFLDRYDEEFLAGIAGRELRIAVDRTSGRALGVHERAWRARGDERIGWQPASGRAVLLSYTVTRRPYAPEFPVPLVHGLVELDEGPRLVCRIVGTPPERLAVGIALAADYDDKGLVFRAAGN